MAMKITVTPEYEDEKRHSLKHVSFLFIAKNAMSYIFFNF